MAVAFISDVDKAPATGSSFTYTSFAVSGTNPLIIVKIALDSTTATVSSVVCSAGLSGTATEIKTQRDAQDVLRTYVSIWAIPAPSGTGTITVTLSASVPYQSNAELWQGADQTTPCPVADAVTANAITNPLSVTPANLTADDAATAFAGNAAAGDAPSFNQTQTYINNTTNVNASGGYHLGTGAVSCTWGTPASDDVIVALRIAAFVGAAANPFASSIGAQLIPRGKPNYSAFCGFVVGTALTLSQGVQQMPVGQQVGFVPAPARTASMTTLGYTQARPQYYQDVKPFAQTEWPLPRLPGTLLSVTINIRPPLDTPAAVVLPFSQTDWPIPQAKPYPLALRTWTQDRKQFYTDIQPFNQTHWPPGRAVPPVPGLSTATSWAQQGVLSLPVGGIPDGRQTLALPIYPPKPSPTLLTWTQAKQISDQPLPPGSPQQNYDWPIPGRAPVPPPTRLTHVSYYVYNTNLPSIPGTTFPLPYGKPYPVALRTYVQGTPRYYTDTVPFNQTDWPLPAPKPRIMGLSTWTQSLVLNTLSIVPEPPIRPVQWDVPAARRREGPPFATSYTQGLLTSSLGAPGWALLLGGERNRLVREVT